MPISLLEEEDVTHIHMALMYMQVDALLNRSLMDVACRRWLYMLRHYHLPETSSMYRRDLCIWLFYRPLNCLSLLSLM